MRSLNQDKIQTPIPKPDKTDLIRHFSKSRNLFRRTNPIEATFQMVV